MLLMSLSPGTSSLVQPVCRPVEQLADQTHADIDLIRADGLGNVRRIDRYLFDIEVFLLEIAVFDRDIHRRRTQRGGVDQAEMGGPAVRSAVSGGVGRGGTAAAAGGEREGECAGECTAQHTGENPVLFHVINVRK